MRSTGRTTPSRSGARRPAPLRGELIRLFAMALREHKADLARLVQIEAGKIESEALGEVQEMIDICDFAVGLSRQLHGLTIAIERPGHRLMEQWHPLGPVGVITRVQLPRRGVVVERRAGRRVRQPGALEAERADAADRARHAGAVRTGRRSRSARRRTSSQVLLGDAERRRGDWSPTTACR